MANLQSMLRALGACKDALEVAGNQSPQEAWEEWPTARVADLHWLARKVRRFLPQEYKSARQRCLYQAADRALRVHAAKAMDAAMLPDHAAKLRSLAPVVDAATADAGRKAGRAAAAAAAAAAYDDAYAAAAYAAAYAAADAAAAAAYDDADAAYAADAAADADARQEVRAKARLTEQEQQMRELKAALPYAVISAAVESYFADRREAA